MEELKEEKQPVITEPKTDHEMIQNEAQPVETPIDTNKHFIEKMLDDIKENANKTILTKDQLDNIAKNRADFIKEEYNKSKDADTNKLSIEGSINWRLLVNLETKETQVVYNNSIANEGAILGLSHQLIDGIIAHAKNNNAKSKDTQRLRIAQFELQKLFGKCLDYIVNNKDKELTKKEE